jgi:hypothetical protein
VIKSGEFDKDEQIKVWGSFLERWLREFCSEMFHNSLRKSNINARSKISKINK